MVKNSAAGSGDFEMKTSKVHAFCPNPERGMPIDISLKYYDQGLRGTKCGYMRKVAVDDSDVTCFFCLKKMDKTQTGERP